MHCYPSCEGKKILVIGITVESVANLKNSLNGEFPGGKWFGLFSPAAGGMGSIPGLRTKISHATQCGQKERSTKIN